MAFSVIQKHQAEYNLYTIFLFNYVQQTLIQISMTWDKSNTTVL
jgi:hypothetical protein